MIQLRLLRRLQNNKYDEYSLVNENPIAKPCTASFTVGNDIDRQGHYQRFIVIMKDSVSLAREGCRRSCSDPIAQLVPIR